MRSVSAVPAGITKYREGLYPLELFTKEEAGQVIDMIESRQKKYYENLVFILFMPVMNGIFWRDGNFGRRTL